MPPTVQWFGTAQSARTERAQLPETAWQQAPGKEAHGLGAQVPAEAQTPVGMQSAWMPVEQSPVDVQQAPGVFGERMTAWLKPPAVL